MAKGLINLKRLKLLGLKLIVYAKKVTLPFFDGVPIYDVSLFFWKSIVDGSITTRASAIAFNFFIALFPSIIFLFTLIPYLPIENFQADLFLALKDFVPESTFIPIEETIQDIIKLRRGGLLSLGFFMALYFSTNGIASMMSAFDATIHSYKRRNWLGQRLVSVILLIILMVLLTAAISLLTIGQNYLAKNNIIQGSFVYYLFLSGKWITIIGLFFIAYSFLYYLAPAKKTKWRFISAGGSLAAVLSIITMVGFGYYINNFSQYNKLYGSIGTLLIVLLLMYFMSLILLIGFELNASIQQAHVKKE